MLNKIQLQLSLKKPTSYRVVIDSFICILLDLKGVIKAKLGTATPTIFRNPYVCHTGGLTPCQVENHVRTKFATPIFT